MDINIDTDFSFYFDYEMFANCPAEIELDAVPYISTSKYCDEDIIFEHNKKIRRLYIIAGSGEVVNKQLFNEVLRISKFVAIYAYYGCDFKGCDLPKNIEIRLWDKCVEYYDKLPRDKGYNLVWRTCDCATLPPFFKNFNECTIDISPFRQHHIDEIGDATVQVYATFDNESIGLNYKNIIFTYIRICDENFNYNLLKNIINNMRLSPSMDVVISSSNALGFINFVKFIELKRRYMNVNMTIKENKDEISKLLFSQLYDCWSIIESNNANLNRVLKRCRQNRPVTVVTLKR